MTGRRPIITRHQQNKLDNENRRRSDEEYALKEAAERRENNRRMRRLVGGGYSTLLDKCHSCKKKPRLKLDKPVKNHRSKLIIECECGIRVEHPFDDGMLNKIEGHILWMGRLFCDEGDYAVIQRTLHKFYCAVCKQHTLTTSADTDDCVVTVRCTNCGAFGRSGSDYLMKGFNEALDDLRRWNLRVTEKLML